MPKKSKHPGLRKHVRKGKAGQVWVYWMLDMRSTGEKDIPLGDDYDKALAKYHEIKSGGTADRGLVREALKRWLADELPTYDVAKTRMDYERHANRMLAWCGHLRWDQVTLPLLAKYLKARSAKTQANRELALLSIVWGKARLWGMTKLPWPAAGVKNWKNVEHARENELDMEVFNAIYPHGDRLLRDAMDLASATALRLTDVREIEMPDGHRLAIDASKTGKTGWFDVRKSSVLAAMVERRLAAGFEHGLLLLTDKGKPVTERMLGERWRAARAAAADEARSAGDTDLADRIERTWMKDNRKLAAELSGDVTKAAKLLQHSSTAVTRRHYFGAAEELEPAR